MIARLICLCLLSCTRVYAFSGLPPSPGRLSTSIHASTVPNSIGQAVQLATTGAELLSVAGDMWLPTDENLPSHLANQLVHHEKRQRWASQLLTKLAVSVIPDTDLNLLAEPRLRRAVLAAAYPPPERVLEKDRADSEGKFISDSIMAIYAIFGRLYHKYRADEFQQVVTDLQRQSDSSQSILDGIQIIVDRTIDVAPEMSLATICQVRWAIRGLITYLGSDLILRGDLSRMSELDELVSGLPFDVIPQAIDWSEWIQKEQPHAPNFSHDAVVQALVSLIPFQKDTIVTRSGSQVVERRGTAWIAADDIGALAYSGKLMPPKPIPEAVSNVLRKAESKLPELMGEPFFDCLLCNHYPDGDAACRFHSDPEHGSHWHRTTAVAAAGSDRRFAFRPITELTSWNEWETRDGVNFNEVGDVATWTYLFAGDMVTMTDRCNDDFYHAVRASEFDGDRGERISLVMKRALDRNGVKGHGLQGEGRRSRRAVQQRTIRIENGGDPTGKDRKKPVGPGGRRGRRRTRQKQ